jgi:hypothetical protein
MRGTRNRFAWFAAGAIAAAAACGGRTSLDAAGGSVTAVGGSGELGGGSSGLSTGGFSTGGAGTGGTNTGGTDVTTFAPPLNQQVLFEVTYRSDTPENRYEGIYIARDGNVYSFDYYATRPRTDPVPIVGISMAAADLTAQYGQSPKLVGYLAQVDLFKTFESIHSMRTALTVQSRSGDSGAQVSLRAWEYDDAAQMYSAVRLGGCGDFLILNLSDFAAPMVDWLCTLGEGSLPMCCDTQIVPQAYTDCSWCTTSGATCVSSPSQLKYCSTFFHCGNGCDCQPVCAGGPTYCRDGGSEGLYCSE